MKVTGIRLGQEDLDWVTSQGMNKSEYIRKLIREAQCHKQREETLREAAERIIREVMGDMKPTQKAEESLQTKAESALRRLISS